MEFLKIKGDILAGHKDKEYNFEWNDMKVTVNLLGSRLLYVLEDRHSSKMAFTVPKDKFMTMSYNRFMKLVWGKIWNSYWFKEGNK